VKGNNLLLLFEQKMKCKYFDNEQLISMLKPWVEFLAENNKISASTILLGDSIDKMPWNIIKNTKGYNIIDNEWTWGTPLSLGYCVSRGIYHLLIRNKDKNGILRNFKGKRIGKIIIDTCSSIFPDYTIKDLINFIRTESEFQSLVYAKSSKLSFIMITISLFWRIKSCPKKILINNFLKNIFNMLKKILIKYFIRFKR